MTWWQVLLIVLVAVVPTVALTVLLLRMLSATAKGQQVLAVLLERAMDRLSSATTDDFLRMQRSSSTSLLYSPSETETATVAELDAYQQAINQGVPDEVAQFLEE